MAFVWRWAPGEVKATVAGTANRFGNLGGSQINAAKLVSLVTRAAVPGRPGAAARATLTRFGYDAAGNPLSGQGPTVAQMAAAANVPGPNVPNAPSPSSPNAPGAPSTPNAPSAPSAPLPPPQPTAPNAPGPVSSSTPGPGAPSAAALPAMPSVPGSVAGANTVPVLDANGSPRPVMTVDKVDDFPTSNAIVDSSIILSDALTEVVTTMGGTYGDDTPENYTAVNAFVTEAAQTLVDLDLAANFDAGLGANHRPWPTADQLYTAVTRGYQAAWQSVAKLHGDTPSDQSTTDEVLTPGPGWHSPMTGRDYPGMPADVPLPDYFDNVTMGPEPTLPSGSPRPPLRLPDPNLPQRPTVIVNQDGRLFSLMASISSAFRTTYGKDSPERRIAIGAFLAETSQSATDFGFKPTGWGSFANGKSPTDEQLMVIADRGRRSAFQSVADFHDAQLAPAAVTERDDIYLPDRGEQTIKVNSLTDVVDDATLPYVEIPPSWGNGGPGAAKRPSDAELAWKFSLDYGAPGTVAQRLAYNTWAVWASKWRRNDPAKYRVLAMSTAEAQGIEENARFDMVTRVLAHPSTEAIAVPGSRSVQDTEHREWVELPAGAGAPDPRANPGKTYTAAGLRDGSDPYVPRPVGLARSGSAFDKLIDNPIDAEWMTSHGYPPDPVLLAVAQSAWADAVNERTFYAERRGYSVIPSINTIVLDAETDIARRLADAQWSRTQDPPVPINLGWGDGVKDDDYSVLTDPYLFGPNGRTGAKNLWDLNFDAWEKMGGDRSSVIARSTQLIADHKYAPDDVTPLLRTDFRRGSPAIDIPHDYLDAYLKTGGMDVARRDRSVLAQNDQFAMLSFTPDSAYAQWIAVDIAKRRVDGEATRHDDMIQARIDDATAQDLIAFAQGLAGVDVSDPTAPQYPAGRDTYIVALAAMGNQFDQLPKIISGNDIDAAKAAAVTAVKAASMAQLPGLEAALAFAKSGDPNDDYGWADLDAEYQAIKMAIGPAAARAYLAGGLSLVAQEGNTLAQPRDNARGVLARVLEARDAQTPLDPTLISALLAVNPELLPIQYRPVVRQPRVTLNLVGDPLPPVKVGLPIGGPDPASLMPSLDVTLPPPVALPAADADLSIPAGPDLTGTPPVQMLAEIEVGNRMAHANGEPRPWLMERAASALANAIEGYVWETWDGGPGSAHDQKFNTQQVDVPAGEAVIRLLSRDVTNFGMVTDVARQSATAEIVGKMVDSWNGDQYSFRYGSNKPPTGLSGPAMADVAINLVNKLLGDPGPDANPEPGRPNRGWVGRADSNMRMMMALAMVPKVRDDGTISGRGERLVFQALDTISKAQLNELGGRYDLTKLSMPSIDQLRGMKFFRPVAATYQRAVLNGDDPIAAVDALIDNIGPLNLAVTGSTSYDSPTQKLRFHDLMQQAGNGIVRAALPPHSSAPGTGANKWRFVMTGDLYVELGVDIGDPQATTIEFTMAWNAAMAKLDEYDKKYPGIKDSPEAFTSARLSGARKAMLNAAKKEWDALQNGSRKPLKLTDYSAVPRAKSPDPALDPQLAIIAPGSGPVVVPYWLDAKQLPNTKAYFDARGAAGDRGRKVAGREVSGALDARYANDPAGRADLDDLIGAVTVGLPGDKVGDVTLAAYSAAANPAAIHPLDAAYNAAAEMVMTYKLDRATADVNSQGDLPGLNDIESAISDDGNRAVISAIYRAQINANARPVVNTLVAAQTLVRHGQMNQSEYDSLVNVVQSTYRQRAMASSFAAARARIGAINTATYSGIAYDDPAVAHAMAKVAEFDIVADIPDESKVVATNAAIAVIAAADILNPGWEFDDDLKGQVWNAATDAANAAHELRSNGEPTSMVFNPDGALTFLGYGDRAPEQILDGTVHHVLARRSSHVMDVPVALDSHVNNGAYYVDDPLGVLADEALDETIKNMERGLPGSKLAANILRDDGGAVYDGLLQAIYLAQGYSVEPDIISESEWNLDVQSEFGFARGVGPADSGGEQWGDVIPDHPADQYRTGIWRGGNSGMSAYGAGVYMAIGVQTGAAAVADMASRVSTARTYSGSSNTYNFSTPTAAATAAADYKARNPHASVTVRGLRVEVSDQRVIRGTIKRDARLVPGGQDQAEVLGKQLQAMLRKDPRYKDNDALISAVGNPGIAAPLYGYDGYKANDGADYFVLHNRGAIRIVDNDIKV